jgi:hypothetical protein
MLVAIGFFVMVVFIVVGMPLARAFARRIDSKSKMPQLPMGDLIARLERIEQGVEAMSVEIERIADGQRFTTKLLADRKPEALPAPATAPTPASVPQQPNDTLASTGVNPADGTVLTPAARRNS